MKSGVDAVSLKKQEDVSPWQLSDTGKPIESEDLNVHADPNESPEHSKS